VRRSSERQALSASARPTIRLRSPAAISILAPPTSPIGIAPSSTRAARLPLSRKPPLPSPNSASDDGYLFAVIAALAAGAATLALRRAGGRS
jgi:hypothetical protein